MHVNIVGNQSFCILDCHKHFHTGEKPYSVEPHYNEVLGTMKISLLYQVFSIISASLKKRESEISRHWDQQVVNFVIRGVLLYPTYFLSRDSLYNCQVNIVR